MNKGEGGSWWCFAWNRCFCILNFVLSDAYFVPKLLIPFDVANDRGDGCLEKQRLEPSGSRLASGAVDSVWVYMASSGKRGSEKSAQPSKLH